jgi:MFS superfamily sulfate permease-like transporter
MGLFVVAFAPLVGQISQAALAGIMVTVAYDTVAWSSSANAIKAVLNPSKYLGSDGKAVARSERVIDLLALVISSWICYFGNLAVGIVAGVAFQRGMLSILKRLGSRTGGKLKAV